MNWIGVMRSGTIRKVGRLTRFLARTPFGRLWISVMRSGTERPSSARGVFVARQRCEKSRHRESRTAQGIIALGIKPVRDVANFKFPPPACRRGRRRCSLPGIGSAGSVPIAERSARTECGPTAQRTFRDAFVRVNPCSSRPAFPTKNLTQPCENHMVVIVQRRSFAARKTTSGRRFL
jgi:hypothetical protein